MNITNISDNTNTSWEEMTKNATDAVSGSSADSNADNQNIDSSTMTITADTEITQESIVRDSETLGEGKGLDFNTVKNKGVVYPLIRINDHFLTEEEIREFYIETGYYKNFYDYKNLKIPLTGFVPTLHLIITTASSDFLKGNIIKSGDKCDVFFSNGGSMVKSYRGDFIIKNVVTSDKPSEVTDKPVTYIIDGELFIPNLRDESQKFNFNGSSRDAMMDCAKRLGLGFFFCDPDDTADYQGWTCSKNLLEYALDVSSHSWKEFNSFFDSWIDPRYGLSFININKMLIIDGFDEPIDITPFVNMINNSVGIDGNKIQKSEEEKRKNSQPQAKILTNITKENESVTPFYIKNWNLVNRAAEIAHEIGINEQATTNIDNPGVDTENTDIDMSYSIPVNNTKMKSKDFYILMGSGVNVTYTQADQKDPNMSFVKSANKVSGGEISETMSNDDADMMQQTGNNMMSSGNTNRFYDAGWEHNMRNNLQLQKQYTEVELSGLNLAIMRGEKIPVLILDNDKVNSTARIDNYTGSEVESLIYEPASGWYIIDGLMWYWSQNPDGKGSTYWRTKLHLVRREWPVAGSMHTTTNENTLTFNHNVDVSSNSSNTTGNNTAGTTATSSLTISSDDITSTDGVPLTGLKQSLKDIYWGIKAICPNIKLVSARRWAVNQDGKRVDGNAFVKRNGLYKCVNAKGEVMYFKSNNSRHLYGEAFDIINTTGQDFNSIMTNFIMIDNELLKSMALSGIAACVEQTTDDSGAAVKHYHFGTEKDIQKTFWESVKALNTHLDDITLNTINNYSAWNQRNYANEIKNTDVEEIS